MIQDVRFDAAHLDRGGYKGRRGNVCHPVSYRAGTKTHVLSIKTSGWHVSPMSQSQKLLAVSALGDAAELVLPPCEQAERYHALMAAQS